MGKLIRFELRKIFRSKYLYVVMAVSVLFVLITGLTVSVSEKLSGAYVTSSYTFVKSALGGTYSMLIGIMVAIAATEDNALGTMKNVIGRGYSRVKVFIAKYFVSFIGVLFVSGISLLVAGLYGVLAFKGAPTNDNVFVVIVGQLFGLLAFHAIYYAISSGFGKIGPAIAVSLIGPMGVSLILTLVDTAIRIKNENSLSDYWVNNLFANFTTPVSNPAIYGRCFGLLAAYFAVALLIGYLINRKREY